MSSCACVWTERCQQACCCLLQGCRLCVGVSISFAGRRCKWRSCILCCLCCVEVLKRCFWCATVAVDDMMQYVATLVCVLINVQHWDTYNCACCPAVARLRHCLITRHASQAVTGSYADERLRPLDEANLSQTCTKQGLRNGAKGGPKHTFTSQHCQPYVAPRPLHCRFLLIARGP